MDNFHLLHLLLTCVLLLSGKGFCLECLELDNIVDCKNQNLEDIPRTMSQIAESVDLSENSIALLSNESFSSQYEPVTRLLLMHNKIVDVEKGSFYPLEKLRVLDLSYNSISSLDPETFANNEMLSSLTISHNPLVSLPPLVSGSIDTLLAEFCDVTTLTDDAFVYLENLRTLSLAGNPIHYASVEAMEPLRGLRQLRIQTEFQNNCYDLNEHPGLRFLVSESPVRVIAEICDIEMYKDHEWFYAESVIDTNLYVQSNQCSDSPIYRPEAIYLYMILSLLIG